MQLSSLEDKLTNNRKIWCEYVLRMDEERIPKKILNMNVTGKHPRGRPRPRKQKQVKKDNKQREERTWEESEEKWWKTSGWRSWIVR